MVIAKNFLFMLSPICVYRCCCSTGRALPLIIDTGLYQTNKSRIYWVKPRRNLPTAFKLFTGHTFCYILFDSHCLVNALIAVDCNCLLHSLWSSVHWLQALLGWFCQEHSWNTAYGVGIICQETFLCTTQTLSPHLRAIFRQYYAISPSSCQPLWITTCTTSLGMCPQSNTLTSSPSRTRWKWSKAAHHSRANSANTVLSWTKLTESC